MSRCVRIFETLVLYVYIYIYLFVLLPCESKTAKASISDRQFIKNRVGIPLRGVFSLRVIRLRGSMRLTISRPRV